MPEPAEAQEWHRIIRASVRECLETWVFQALAGPVTVDALETIPARATGHIMDITEPGRAIIIVGGFLRPESSVRHVREPWRPRPRAAHPVTTATTLHRTRGDQA